MRFEGFTKQLSEKPDFWRRNSCLRCRPKIGFPNQRTGFCCHYHDPKDQAWCYTKLLLVNPSKIWVQEATFSKYNFLLNPGYLFLMNNIKRIRLYVHGYVRRIRKIVVSIPRIHGDGICLLWDGNIDSSAPEIRNIEHTGPVPPEICAAWTLLPEKSENSTFLYFFFNHPLLFRGTRRRGVQVLRRAVRGFVLFFVQVIFVLDLGLNRSPHGRVCVCVLTYR